MFGRLLSLIFSLSVTILAPWLSLTRRILRPFTSPFVFVFSKVFSRCTSVVYTSIILISTSIVLLWLSVLLYGSFYNSYIPTVSHKRDVNLAFSSDCEVAGGGMCTFPKADITLGTSRNAEILRKGQAYRVVLELDMPETVVNQQLGMFMVELTFYSYNGETIQKSSRAVSSMLRYKSYLLQIVETVFYLPLLLMGYREQKQTLDIELFKSYVEDTYKPTIGVVVEVQSRNVHIYHSVLHLNAIFSGLRYLMYEWRLTFSVLGISTIFSFLAIIVLLSFYNCGSTKRKHESSIYYSTDPTPLEVDEIQLAKEQISTERDDQPYEKAAANVEQDIEWTRGDPDGDGNAQDDDTSTLQDDDTSTSGDTDEVLGSKVEDVPSQFPTLRHRKQADST